MWWTMNVCGSIACLLLFEKLYISLYFSLCVYAFIPWVINQIEKYLSYELILFSSRIRPESILCYRKCELRQEGGYRSIQLQAWIFAALLSCIYRLICRFNLIHFHNFFCLHFLSPNRTQFINCHKLHFDGKCVCCSACFFHIFLKTKYSLASNFSIKIAITSCPQLTHTIAVSSLLTTLSWYIFFPILFIFLSAYTFCLREPNISAYRFYTYWTKKKHKPNRM